MENRQKLSREMGMRLREVRDRLGYSREQMAAHLGVGRSAVSKYEYGSIFPGPRALFALASTLGISLDWLIAGKGSMGAVGKGKAGEGDKSASTSAATTPVEETQELLAHMQRIPLLRHEVLRLFYKFKQEYPDLLDSAL